MKNLFKNMMFAVALLPIALGTVSCSSSSGGGAGEMTEREQILQQAATAFVNKTVIPTYKSLSDAAISLCEACETMQEAFAGGNLTTAMVQVACNEWIEARKYWELSEAFLYGAAADYNVDPHIDSWPLNKTELESLLKDPVRMAKMDAEYAGTFLGYGLLGFHALEYMLFENAGPRALNKYTTQELVYTVAVAGDLRNQCVLLEAAWAGEDNVSAEKQEILEDAEMGSSIDYGYSMTNAGQGGSLYRNYLGTAQEIIQGCADIADEVANQKIGRPALGTADEDVNYIESPYSQNSKVDFIDNIRSIRNAYLGTNSGDASVSDYVKKVDPAADTKVREAITAAIAAIEKCETPFVNNRTSANWKASVGVCNDLVTALDAAQSALQKY
ncbi:imelysin family protein [uncultured Alistipes sp.]|jgi:putative iron-regulated protein A|uniref:imelysin family protein n=1 Tax=uncultured Alistipes sp. TaxID=538949 RepID=UPI0025FAD34D|nr:imelysin family protein [uncultured Alistipes sp.]